ncbi:DUF1176 domain-containing protein [Stappia sp. WLB 29]|uniref:DUF1176 domain-containing protein n=1 Tax=Stappia sp. WLB 29 TaxID=2925220 RepID=UPI0020C12154|nr:DUF1176 domain-containing protein [Stappia sp. WLB 29]
MSPHPIAERRKLPARHSALATAALLCLLAGLSSPRAQADTFGEWQLDCATREACRLATQGREELTGEPLFVLALSPSGDALALELAVGGPRPDDIRAMQWQVDGDLVHVLRPGEFALHGDTRRFFVTDAPAGRKLLDALRGGARLRISYLDAVAEAHDAVFSLDGLTVGLEAMAGQLKLPAAPKVAAPAFPEVPAPSRSEAVAALGIPYAVLERHARSSDCEATDSDVFRNVSIPIGALGQTAVLYAIPCTVSGETVTYRLYMRDTGEIGGIETLYFALHDPRFGWTGTDLLSNVRFDHAAGVLTAEYVGPGDRVCGYRASWSWQDHAFRMERFEGPDDCRNASRPANWTRQHPR